MHGVHAGCTLPLSNVSPLGRPLFLGALAVSFQGGNTIYLEFVEVLWVLGGGSKNSPKKDVNQQRVLNNNGLLKGLQYVRVLCFAALSVG